MEIELDVKQLADSIKEELFAPEKVWDNYIPIVDGEEGFTAYLSNEVIEPAAFNELCDHISKTTADDVVTLKINNGGGDISSAFMLIDAIKSSAATVNVELSGTVASAATMIALSANSIKISPFCSFMIHNYSGGMAGKGNELKARQKHIDSHLELVFESIYADLLTEEEVVSVIDGTDIWLSGTEVVERLDNACLTW